ncbi:MAG: hypothetical protein KZQ70_08390 [gamma proteobacterium symbiont of Lucinoma myriamae]|nr:hypothetical protein [gamma proteobacterium symbiont of Lucinoma myriamae]MCU7819500.1 hypothetical protein [gamma proteobacterium symbiont of Lucinoma myriamae]MCU7832549.1 hypothetical protein [gamma proteobacterium symbiont of Lucinoma myriamae]
MTHIKLAPNVEFKMDINLDNITDTSRDYDVQQHKTEIYQEFEKRLAKVFPEGFKIDSMDFGLDKQH